MKEVLKAVPIDAQVNTITPPSSLVGSSTINPTQLNVASLSSSIASLILHWDLTNTERRFGHEDHQLN